MRQVRFIFLPLLLITLSENIKAWPVADSVAQKKIAERAYGYYLSYPDSSIVLANSLLATQAQPGNVYIQGFSYLILSRANWTKSNYQLSLEYGFKALKVLENSSYTNLWGQSLLALARTSIELHDYQQGQTFLIRAQQLAIRHLDDHLLADTYRERSMLLTERGQYDSALYYVDKGLVFYHRYKDMLDLSVLYSRKAKIYFALRNYKKSSQFNRLSLRLDSLVGNRRALSIAFYYAALNSFQLNKADSAIYFLTKSLQVAKGIHSLNSIQKGHDLLAEIYEKTNRPALAVAHLRLAAQYKDSLFNAEKNAKIEELRSLYELEIKDRTISELEQENQQQFDRSKDQRLLTVALAVGVILLLAFILMLTRLRSIQKKANDVLEEKNRSIEQQSEEMHAQAEYLQHLNQLKSKLFSVISHDVRGPIATLQSLMELVTSNVMTQEEFLQVSDKLKTSLNVTQQTLENLLNWSLSQMDGLKTEMKAVRLHHAVNDVARLLEDAAERKKLVISNHSDPDIQVLADTNQLQLILRNLIHNAIKFSKTDGIILISTFPGNSTCTIVVKDSGIGMTPEEVAKVNGEEHFTKRGTQQEKGTGLGLFLCKEFIKHHGGELTVKSETGRGTEISFTLRLAE